MLRTMPGVRFFICILGLSALAGLATAQAYPQKPIRYVVPYAPGGGTDTLTRLIAQKLSTAWNVPVVVENRAGASARIGTEAVARSAPDGYTMLMAINSHAINASLYNKLPYDPIQDFAPVILVATSPNVVTVHPSVPAKSMKELIELAQSQPGRLTYSSGGPGSGSNLAGALLRIMANVNIVEVPYKGAGPAMTDLLGGQVSMSFVVLQTAFPHMTSGKLRALAVTSSARSALAPELPTVAESLGLAGYDVFSWYGTLAPAGTSPEIVNKWNSEITKIVAMPEVKEKLAALGMEIKGGTPKQFDQFIRSDWELWDKVIKSLGIRLE